VKKILKIVFYAKQAHIPVDWARTIQTHAPNAKEGPIQQARVWLIQVHVLYAKQAHFPVDWEKTTEILAHCVKQVVILLEME